MSRLISALLLAFFIAACSAVGLVSPQTLDQKATVAIASATSARSTALTLLQARKISPRDAQNLQNQADAIRAGADVALELAKTDPAAADQKLVQTQALLRALQAYLIAKEAAK